MRNVILVSFLGLVACTKPNPNRCCTDEADCAANDIPDGSTCSDGLVCRGNQCIAETCTTSASDCESSDPYCVDGLCGAACTDDTQCPGAGDDPSKTHCTNGVCVACAMNTDCPASAPVCDSTMNACRGCQMDTECDSQVCDVDMGTCVDTSTIRYASPTGPDTADCSQATPCSLTTAVGTVDLQHPTVRMLPGTYTDTIALTSASLQIVGTGATLMGEITATSSSMSMRGLAIVGVSTNGDYAYRCTSTNGTLREVNIQGFTTLDGCSLTIEQLTDTNFEIDDHNDLTIDRSFFYYIELNDPSTLTLTMTNSVVAGPMSVELVDAHPVVTVNVSYSTFYCPDCEGEPVVDCESLPAAESITFTNNIFDDPGQVEGAVLDHGNAGNNLCIFTNNITYPQPDVISSNIALDPRFADAANGDFHLTAGSPAIDSAIVTGTDPAIDYDGTTRPQGARDDIGAFEFKQ